MYRRRFHGHPSLTRLARMRCATPRPEISLPWRSPAKCRHDALSERRDRPQYFGLLHPRPLDSEESVDHRHAGWMLLRDEQTEFHVLLRASGFLDLLGRAAGRAKHLQAWQKVPEEDAA